MMKMIHIMIQKIYEMLWKKWIILILTTLIIVMKKMMMVELSDYNSYSDNMISDVDNDGDNGDDDDDGWW